MNWVHVLATRAAADRKTPADLWDRYRRLSDSAQSVLHLKSLIGWDVGKTVFLNLLAPSRVPSPDGKAWTARTLNPILDDLRRQGLLLDDLSCPPGLLHPLAIAAMASRHGPALAAAVRAEFPGETRYLYLSRHYPEDVETARRLRLAVYADTDEDFARWLARYNESRDPRFGPHLLDRMLAGTPVDAAWFAGRPRSVQFAVLSIKLQVFLDAGIADANLSALMDHGRTHLPDPEAGAFRWLLTAWDLLGGRLAQARRMLDTGDGVRPSFHTALSACLTFLAGDNPAALADFRSALKLLRKEEGRRKLFLPDPEAQFFLLALLEADDAALHDEIDKALDLILAENRPQEVGHRAIQTLRRLGQGREPGLLRADLEAMRRAATPAPVPAALLALAELAVDPALARQHRDDTAARFAALKDTAPLIAGIFAEVLARVAADPTPYQTWLTAPEREPTIRFAGIVAIREPWERALESLDSFLTGAAARPADAGSAKAKRLAWFVDPDLKTVEVLEQSTKGKDGWTPGRAVALKRFHEKDARLDYLSDHDRRALRAIYKSNTWYDEFFAFDEDRALVALVGHPLVFDARHRDRRLELVAYPVELVVREQGNGFHVALSHRADRPTVFLEAETPTRWRVLEVTPTLLKVQEMLGQEGIEVPREARERLIALVRRDSPALPIRAEIADVDLPAIAGDPTPVVQMQPLDEGGVRVSLAVRPFGAAGPHYLPGQGGHSVLAAIDGGQRRAKRDLTRERAERTALVAACPALAERGADAPEWIIEDTEGVLDFLTQLQACPTPVPVEWPEGRRLTVGPEVSAAALSVKISHGRDWFAVAGTVAVDGDLVVDLRDLLDRLERAQGRFVPLDDGRFVTLTRHFQAQLQRFKAVSESGKDGRRVSRLGSLAMRDLVEDAGAATVDRSWRQFVDQLREAEGFTPAVPPTLQAELRDYQVEGFAWMARLARWGAGACLADDMGLGKTVQALAVMLDLARGRAGAAGTETGGPCLVVAPTSVCGNWVAEIARFAPTLTAHRLATAGDRAALVAGLGPGDVLITSYGLLHQEAELLGGVSWRVAVFDEAQALKNAETKRAQASQGIAAGFRLALTGTPIENDLDELWSLFNVVAPGLLGSREGFQKRFAVPIQRDRDAHARQALKALIRPFILRRTKSVVLSELPPRTEVTLLVEPGADERAFHEALREKALATIARLREEGGPGSRKLHILAEITRLRRACCDPGLVTPEANIAGAKLAAFLDLVEELRANHHRALVFSQFVGFLDRVRAALDARGVRYQYLDGSTPARERERRVAAFQGGEGELFLISLKAGGVGLNLTAADYVIHLDPWWNPAVEDQASDRAHRIGQHRPVTIYRLIVQDSIEEKIVALHRDKRDLAADLLEGAEIAGRLSEEALLDLIRG